MTAPYDVAVLVGSLRRGSWSRRVALAYAGLAPGSLRCEVVDLREVAMYDADLEVVPPPAGWTALRDRVRRADALLFVTPEYNRSLPAVLKNAVDVASRPFAGNPLRGKPCALVGVSPGAMGAFGAVAHLRQSVACLEMPVFPGPEVYLGKVETLLDERGEVTNPATAAFLTKSAAAFAAWLERVAPRA